MTRKKKVKFSNVKIFYFSRTIGLDKVPEVGTYPLGMKLMHFHYEEYKLNDEQEKNGSVHNVSNLSDSHIKRKRRSVGSINSNNDNDSESVLSCKSIECDKSGLVALTSSERKIRLASVTESMNNDDKKQLLTIRRTRLNVGCNCKGKCDPIKCNCAREGIPCHDDGKQFPCKCGDKCNNEYGKRVYCFYRIVNHYDHINENPFDDNEEFTMKKSNVTSSGDCKICTELSEAHIEDLVNSRIEESPARITRQRTTTTAPVNYLEVENTEIDDNNEATSIPDIDQVNNPTSNPTSTAHVTVTDDNINCGASRDSLIIPVSVCPLSENNNRLILNSPATVISSNNMDIPEGYTCQQYMRISNVTLSNSPSDNFFTSTPKRDLPHIKLVDYSLSNSSISSLLNNTTTSYLDNSQSSPLKLSYNKSFLNYPYKEKSVPREFKLPSVKFDEMKHFINLTPKVIDLTGDDDDDYECHNKNPRNDAQTPNISLDKENILPYLQPATDPQDKHRSRNSLFRHSKSRPMSYIESPVAIIAPRKRKKYTPKMKPEVNKLTTHQQTIEVSAVEIPTPLSPEVLDLTGDDEEVVCSSLPIIQNNNNNSSNNQFPITSNFNVKPPTTSTICDDSSNPAASCSSAKQIKLDINHNRTL